MLSLLFPSTRVCWNKKRWQVEPFWELVLHFLPFLRLPVKGLVRTFPCLSSWPCPDKSRGQLIILPIHIIVLVWVAVEEINSQAEVKSSEAAWNPSCLQVLAMDVRNMWYLQEDTHKDYSPIFLATLLVSVLAWSALHQSWEEWTCYTGTRRRTGCTPQQWVMPWYCLYNTSHI